MIRNALSIARHTIQSSLRVLLTVMLLGIPFAGKAQATELTCGATVSQNVKLESDIGPCSNEALTIAADNVTVDLNGHRLFGATGEGNLVPTAPGVGIYNRRGVTVTSTAPGGQIDHFFRGVLIKTSGNTVSNVTIRDNISNEPDTANNSDSAVGDGVALVGQFSDNNSILDNMIINNGPISAIRVRGGTSRDPITGLVISGNTILDNNTAQGGAGIDKAAETDGIRLEDWTSGAVISKNTIKGSGKDGIAITANTQNISVFNNTISGNGFSSVLTNNWDEAKVRRGDGIRVYAGAASHNIRANSVTGNAGNGISLEGPTQPSIAAFPPTQSIQASPTPGANFNSVVGNTVTGNSQSDDPPTVPPAPSPNHFDLNDGNTNPPCANNVWLANSFGDANQTCATNPSLALNIGDTSVTEGSPAVLRVSLTRSLDKTASVKFETAELNASDPASQGAARKGVDFVDTAGTLTFRPGEVEKTLQVPTIDDGEKKGCERFYVNLSDSTNAPIGKGQGVVTIIDNHSTLNGCSALSVNDIEVKEGGPGDQTKATFTVTLSSPPLLPVTVNYATADQTATAGEDYTPANGSLTFNAGETSKKLTSSFNGNPADPQLQAGFEGDAKKPVDISIIGDNKLEPNETFLLKLSDASNVGIVRPEGKATILNDDGPKLTVDDISVTEGNEGSKQAHFTATLSEPGPEAVTADYSFEDGSAAQPTDYSASPGAIKFEPGQVTAEIPVFIIGNRKPEEDKTFYANLHNATGANPVKSRGKATILNDDPFQHSAVIADPPPSVSINDFIRVNEGNSGQTNAIFTISLSRANDVPVTVGYTTEDRTATSPSDYEAASGTLTFSPGQVSQTLIVKVNGDTIAEPDETFAVSLHSPVNAVLFRDLALGTLVDDDGDGALGCSGGIFLTGHDSDAHALLCPGPGCEPARRIIRRAVGFVTKDKPQPKLLYVTSGCGNGLNTPDCAFAGKIDYITDEALRVSGFSNVTLAGKPIIPRPDIRDLSDMKFSDFDAVVVASLSNHVTQRELDVLDSRKTELFSYLRSGGGVVAFEERLTPPVLFDSFQYIPEPPASSSLNQDETGITVTPAGREFGLTDTDVSRNASHQYFDGQGWDVLDKDQDSHGISLAKRVPCGPVGRNGVAPPTPVQDSIPRSGTGALAAGLPPVRTELPNPKLPQNEQPGEAQAALGRHPESQDVVQNLSQPSAQSQTQAQPQAQLQNQFQQQSQIQIQPQQGFVKEKQRQVQAQVAKAEVAPDRAVQPRELNNHRGHLASARQTVPPTAAAVGGLASLMLLTLGLFRSKKQSAASAPVPSAKQRFARPNRRPPNHRRR